MARSKFNKLEHPIRVFVNKSSVLDLNSKDPPYLRLSDFKILNHAYAVCMKN